MQVAVFGLWHLGCVTAACMAEAGFRAIGLDPDRKVVADLQRGQPPLQEPGLAELVARGLAAGTLSFTSDPAEALNKADVLWVTFDTPVNERDEADVGFVRTQLESIPDLLRPGTLVLVSSQVPVGFTRSLERDWQRRELRYACSPENLRLGKAIDAFKKPERVILGTAGDDPESRARLTALFSPFCQRLEWMSVESAEMTKHAINAFLATSVTFINELGRLCEAVGADAKEVERGLKSEGRIGPKAYLSPGAAFAGGTLARDLRFLSHFGRERGVGTPLFDGVLASNDLHKSWIRDKVSALLAGRQNPVVALLGLAYKVGTSTLRRSGSVELGWWLRGQGAEVRGHDPAVKELPAELSEILTLYPTALDALRGADLAIVATEWPDYRALSADDFAGAMRRPAVVDQNWFLAKALERDPRVTYVATGRGA